MKIIIGLTGGIASGKSTVAAMLKEKGAWVVDADQVARQVVEKGKPALDEIVEAFGTMILQADGTLNREALGRGVFANDEKRRLLNQITHPRIRREMLHIMKVFRENDPRQVLVLEVPLLFETGIDQLVDQIWLVDIEEEKQVRRLMERSKLSKREACARIQSQMPQTEKRKRSHILIDNNGDRHMLQKGVNHQWEELMMQLNNKTGSKKQDNGC
ncbi:dephospho-CoA kinase [Anoxynatronum sibiricum]|uniref:Dephospho-CoA kinase n=1 Tax=Anoxynatronum sibiricum TaxID=210623 RepID=A0ABU9VRD9_9CLOT